MTERSEVRAALDELVPRWHRREVHRLAVAAPAAEVIKAARELTWGEVPVFRRIVTIAGLGRVRFPASDQVLDMFLSNGFAVLHHSETELVVGGIERISRRQPVVPLGERPAEVFHEFDEPRHIKLGFNFRMIDGVLTTETRVQATDGRASKIFAVYWFLIRGGSGLIRRVWLRGIRKRATR